MSAKSTTVPMAQGAWEGGVAQRRIPIHTAPIEEALVLCLEGGDLGWNLVREAKGLIRSMGLR